MTETFGVHVGCCQRDVNYYEFLASMREEIEHKILDFFENHVVEKFPNRNCECFAFA